MALWSESSGCHLLVETSRQLGVGGRGQQDFISDREKPGLESLTVKVIHCPTDTGQSKGEKGYMCVCVCVCVCVCTRVCAQFVCVDSSIIFPCSWAGGNLEGVLGWCACFCYCPLG